MTRHFQGGANKTWISYMNTILEQGSQSSPRGMMTRTLLNQQFIVDPRCAVITVPERDLNYRFMMAEALWILSGSNKAEDIVPWNKQLAAFSDDGESFFGAYGPKVMNQIDYVVRKLESDMFTRQAVINIWRENPPDTKDVPCTLNAIFYRNPDTGRLCATFNMRSSDAWLGIPYDIFNFSMITLYVAARLGILPGTILLNLVNGHCYARDVAKIEAIIETRRRTSMEQLDVLDYGAPYMPDTMFSSPKRLIEVLTQCRDTKNKAECLVLWKELCKERGRRV